MPRKIRRQAAKKHTTEKRTTTKRASRDLHVVPSVFGDGWSVRKSGAPRASKIFPTRERAIEHGRKLAKDTHTELYVHRHDGRISDVRSYVKDRKATYK